MSPWVSILLLNYNGKKFNQACLTSILAQTYQNFEILFIDNASSDDSLEEVENLFEKEIKSWKLRVIRNEKNEGFANGNNIGHRLASKESKYICLLNNDTTVEKNWLGELVKVIEWDESLWAVGSMILDQWYEKEIQSMVIWEGKVTVQTVIWEYSTKKVSHKEKLAGIYYTSALSGNSILYKKTIVDQPFPEWYFAYGEDVFLSMYLLSSGYKLAYCVKSVVHHYGSGSFGKNPSDFKLFYGNRNQIVNFFLFYSWQTTLKLLPLFLLVQLGHLFVNAPLKRLKAKCKARIWILKHQKAIKSLRIQVQKDKKLTDKELLAQLSKDFTQSLYLPSISKTKGVLTVMNKFFNWYCNIIL